MHIRDLCQLRFEMANGTKTPLLIPSFSSRGFIFLKDLYRYISQFLTETSLISAFDIYYKFLPIESVYNSDIVFIDSGGYENKISENHLEAYHDTRESRKWNFNFYDEIISNIEPLTDLIVISYDEVNNVSLKNQIEKAILIQKKYDNFSVDFLWKPEPNESFYNDPKILIPYINEIRNFRCLGVTDKELGSSLYKRCKKLVEIRSILTKYYCNIPIHIFGCLDPLNSFLFFLCGADIFDGLSWLRYSFSENICIYMEQYPLLTENFELSDEDIKFKILIQNLFYLNKIQKIMKLYSISLKPENIHISARERKGLKSILEKIQISTEGVL